MKNIELPGGECRPVADVLANLDEILSEACPALPTGIDSLDQVLGGGVRGWFVVVGGKPGSGKTDLAVNIALSLAHYRPVVFVSFELSTRQLIVRVISSVSAQGELRHALTSEDLLDHRKDGVNPVLIMQAKERLSTVARSFVIADHTTIGSFDETLAVAHLGRLVEACRANGNAPAAVIIDYVQQFPVEGNSSAAASTDHLDRLARDLASLAHRAETPVIALSSMTKTGEYRGSSHLEHAADLTLMVTHEKNPDDPPTTPAVMTIDIKKNRDGRAGISTKAQYWPAYHHIH